VNSKKIKTGGLPMKKALKIITLVIMLLGIAFSISNFVSLELRAKEGIQGIWIDGDCQYFGNQCNIEIELP
jgi:hypothetical protein